MDKNIPTLDTSTRKKVLSGKYKATDNRLVIILNAVSRGYTARDAARLAGISEDTLSLWKKDSDFSEQMEQKELEYKYSLLGTIQKAGEKSWQACAWILERKYPGEFGKSKGDDGLESLSHAQNQILEKLSKILPD